MRIGLTGGIAAGKSLVSKTLANLGAHILDADAVSRQVVEPGTEGLQKIVDEFGAEMLTEQGTLNRAALGAAVFADEEKLNKLNSILHPFIKSELLNRATAIEQQLPDDIVVMDVPLLIEAGWQDAADEVWLVTAPIEERIRRIAVRDGLDGRQAMQRIASQMPDEQKAKYAHVIINNSGSIGELRDTVSRLYAERKHGKKEETQEK